MSILITGASSPLGMDLLNQLQDSSLVVHYHTNKVNRSYFLRMVKNENQILCSDFEDPIQWEAFLKQLERFNFKAVIHIPSLYHFHQTVIDEDPIHFQRLYHFNVLIPLKLHQALYPSLATCHGKIIHFGVRRLDQISFSTHAPAYLSSKKALLFLCRSLNASQSQVKAHMINIGLFPHSKDYEMLKHKVPTTSIKAVSQAVCGVLEGRFNDDCIEV